MKQKKSSFVHHEEALKAIPMHYKLTINTHIFSLCIFYYFSSANGCMAMTLINHR